MEYQVDPHNIPNKMTKAQVEYFVLFGICVAGKNAKTTAVKLNNLLSCCVYCTPFQAIRTYIAAGFLQGMLEHYKFGQYKRIHKAFCKVTKLDVDCLTIETLESIPGIGPKTARMILLYSDPKANCVPLDTHILKYLNAMGYDAPKSTPPAGKRYKELEQAFKGIAQSKGKTVRELDTEVWKMYSERKTSTL